MRSVWYRRELVMPDGWLSGNRRTHIHIGACDYRTRVWVNGENVGIHTGVYVSFSFDITNALHSGSNTIVIQAEDDIRCPDYPSGKQSDRYGSFGCMYTRPAGITSKSRRAI